MSCLTVAIVTVGPKLGPDERLRETCAPFLEQGS
jgi:hypothetical protein